MTIDNVELNILRRIAKAGLKMRDAAAREWPVIVAEARHELMEAVDDWDNRGFSDKALSAPKEDER